MPIDIYSVFCILNNWVTQSYTSAKAKKLQNLVLIIMTQTAGTGSTPPHPSLLNRTERNCSRDLTPVLTLRVQTSQANQRPLLAHQERRLIEGQKNLSASTISHSQPEKGVADCVRPKPGFSIGNRNQDQVLVSVLVADAEIELPDGLAKKFDVDKLPVDGLITLGLGVLCTLVYWTPIALENKFIVSNFLAWGLGMVSLGAI